MFALDAVWRGVDSIARHKRFSVLLTGALAFVGCWMIAQIKGFPVPHVADEFSYLLGADTFAHGRLTKPPHPLWQVFESVHILQQPTYMSKYPPASALVLALGQVLFGHPVYGVWIGMALMCGGICWMLQAWTKPRWALLGCLFAVFHPTLGITSYWAQLYWGGAIPAFGGALFFGGLRRIFQRPNVKDSFWMGLGLAVLANSRPFEGLIAALPGIGLFFCWFLKQSREKRFGNISVTVFSPLIIVGALTLLAMGYYNQQVPGDFRTAPYRV